MDAEELYQCPYERACKCDLKDCCLECETFGKYLNGNTILPQSKLAEMPSEEEFIKLGKELQSHRLSYTIENDDGDGLPLVDMLTPNGDKDISRGLQEIEYIVDAVYDWLKSLTESKQEEFELKFCEKCYQMTNHIGDECQKCKVKQKEPLHKVECIECGALFMSPNPEETICLACETTLNKKR